MCGGYPLGAENDPRAPWNQDEPRMKTCPCCGGLGHTGFRAFNIRTRQETEVKEIVYDMLPEDEDVAEALHQNYCKMPLETCPKCDGAGEIEDDFDFDDYYDNIDDV